MIIHCKYDALVDPSKLKDSPFQTNRHPKDQIERLAKVISYQGFRYPIKISKRTDTITTGHGRRDAAILSKWNEVPVVYQDYEDDDQERADVTSDNAVALWAELDLKEINAQIGDFDPSFDIDLLGIKDFTLDVADKGAADETPEPPKDPISKLGDIYELGEHRLMCGDATQDVDTLLDGAKIDMVYTDPPYGMNLDTDYSGIVGSKTDNTGFQQRNRKTKPKKYEKVIGDSEYFDPSFLFGLFNSKEMFLWGGDYYCWDLPKKGSWVVWDKTGGHESLLNAGFGSNFELCWSMKPHKRDIAKVTYKGVAGMKKEDGKRVHPTQKPVGLAEWFFTKWGKDTKTVADLYGGSGSTLIACEKTNRKCFMMELAPEYVDVIVSRYCKYTNNYNITRNGEPMEWLNQEDQQSLEKNTATT